MEYDSDSGSSSKEQEDEVLDGELEIPRSRSDSLCSGNDEPDNIKVHLNFQCLIAFHV